MLSRWRPYATVSAAERSWDEIRRIPIVDRQRADWHPRLVSFFSMPSHRSHMGLWRVLALALIVSGCGTVDLGDNFVPPDLMLDEDFFFCRIQPEVLSRQSCASGTAADAGGCHSARSSLRLDPMAEMDSVTCDGDVLIGLPPASYEFNLEAIRFTVQSDPASSPLYRRPLNQDSHPRQIFDASSAEADLISTWILMGGS